MSAPSSDGRPSISSEPSAASSPTLNSRYSGAYGDNGEGSSSPRPSAGSRSDSTPRAPLDTEFIEEQDFAHRRHRPRKSGGFLLDSAFPSGPRARHPSRRSAHFEDHVEKRSSRHGHGDHEGSEYLGKARDGHNGSATSSPLRREVVVADTGTIENGEETGNGHGHDEGLRVPKSRKSTRESSPDMRPQALEQGYQPPRPAIDPNQIVSMALNLSESRRRNLGAGQLIVPQSAGSRRITSVGSQMNGAARDYSGGSSLRQYLNDQRRSSRNMSPGGGRSPSGMRKLSASMNRSVSMAGQGRSWQPGTFVRRDKALAYFELKWEYLRLLEFLPPLKPDSSAPGNFVITATNVPGSPHAYLSRVPSYANQKHELGRAYNPLQYIRNRRSRARERKSLDHPPPEFSDVDRVRDWVDRVENEAQYSTYRRQDRVSLPKIHDDHDGNPVPSTPPRPHRGWLFTPEELLADAHWLEQGDNKSILDDRHGRKIFPPAEPQKQDFLQPRDSKEYPEKRRRSWVEGISALSGDPQTGDESEPISERGRKHRLLPAFRAESPKRKKHGWRGSVPRSDSSSSSSDSDSGSQRNPSRRSRKLVDVNNNTGPLGLHINSLIEKETREEKMKSPTIISPDTPDKWGDTHQHHKIDGNTSARSSPEVPAFSNGSIKGDQHTSLKMPPKRRTDHTIAPEPRSSFEDMDSTAPSTPLHARPFHHDGMDLSPPPSRGGSVKKTKKHPLDIFRSDESAKGHKHERDSVDKKRNSRHVSEDAPDTSVSSAILAAPHAVKSLLTHRKNDSVSSLPSPEYRKDRKDTKEFKDKDLKEPPSAVTKFFKDVKSGGSKGASKVEKFIFKRDRAADDSDTDSIASVQAGSDTDDGPKKKEQRHRPRFVRSTTASTTTSITSVQPKTQRLDLPSFRSQKEQERGYVSDSGLPEDPITRQARARANSRSARFDALAPPRMDLRSLSATATRTRSRSQSPGASRMNKVLARPGGVGQGGLPMNPLAPTQNPRPALGRRHWSIADEEPVSRSNPLITSADIARIRALFLCSGIKARRINTRATEHRSPPPPWLTRAAAAATTTPIAVSRKEEHVLAAKLLTAALESRTTALHSSATRFQSTTMQSLVSQIAALKAQLESNVFPRVRSTADDAVRITSQVSGEAPLAVKQISDEMDAMVRMRRRRTRWVRRVGWMLVEWLVLGVMWWAWLVVMVLGTCRRVVGAVWGVVRWLLWL
ncbi:hypothetical protein K491DRAFT_705511 [Lophiostoma macrostomum CBS 122681]|uniref:Uncharacterized protein n=1 Tax=Lophiostoma macrostomum CBS 122681 TaxID=1314788 RepID=A0A6A6T230_9PLEO|nr:hypothetical protein K491DRAFT_705511 [Lophiostoma macrostomum CBS 122681]